MKRYAEARWTGPVETGEGSLALGSRTFEGPYSFKGRNDGTGTNPEELIGAAHAGCFTMAFSSRLTRAGHAPEELTTSATVHLVSTPAGYRIPKIELATRGSVPGISETEFTELAQAAKETCPVSVALAGVDISLDVELISQSSAATASRS